MPSRRAVLASSAAGVGAVVLAACGASSGSGDSGNTGTSGDSGNSQRNQPQDGGSTASSTTSSAAAKPLTSLDEITVGEAVSVTLPDGSPALVSRPSKDTVACFSAKCTHMGCTVKPDGDKLHCPCHGSTFDPNTGKVTHGPADRPLPEIPVHLAGDKVISGA